MIRTRKLIVPDLEIWSGTIHAIPSSLHPPWRIIFRCRWSKEHHRIWCCTVRFSRRWESFRTGNEKSGGCQYRNIGPQHNYLVRCWLCRQQWPRREEIEDKGNQNLEEIGNVTDHTFVHMIREGHDLLGFQCFVFWTTSQGVPSYHATDIILARFKFESGRHLWDAIWETRGESVRGFRR